MGNFEKASDYYNKALNIYKLNYKEKHPLIAAAYHNIALNFPL